jgi:hypothetical protein
MHGFCGKELIACMIISSSMRLASLAFAAEYFVKVDHMADAVLLSQTTSEFATTEYPLYLNICSVSLALPLPLQIISISLL